MNGNNESPEETIAEEALYDLHIRLERKMRETLKDAAMLAYKLGNTNYILFVLWRDLLN